MEGDIVELKKPSHYRHKLYRKVSYKRQHNWAKQTNCVGNTDEFDLVLTTNRQSKNRMQKSYDQRARLYDQVKQDLEQKQGTNDHELKQQDVPPIIKEFLTDGERERRMKDYPGNKFINLKRLSCRNWQRTF